MKKLVNLSVLCGMIALILLLAAGSAAAAPEQQLGGTALRINFEVGGHKARGGLYVVQYPGGDVLTSWSAHNGATDSGWINVDISRKTVWVEVLYYPGPNTAPTTMRILNPAPGTAYGWVSQGMSHAIEVAWPDMQVMPTDSMQATPYGPPWQAAGGMMVRPSYAMAQGPYGMPGPYGRPFGVPGRPYGMPGTPSG